MLTASLKFVGLNNFNLPAENTKDFTDLQTQISRSLRNTQLKQVPGFVDVSVFDFYRQVAWLDDNSSFIPQPEMQNPDW